MIIDSNVFLLCSFLYNLHFHCCLALKVLIIIIIRLRYFCLMNFHYIQITTQTSATKKKRIGTEFDILFPELYHTIF